MYVSYRNSEIFKFTAFKIFGIKRKKKMKFNSIMAIIGGQRFIVCNFSNFKFKKKKNSEY